MLSSAVISTPSQKLWITHSKLLDHCLKRIIQIIIHKHSIEIALTHPILYFVFGIPKSFQYSLFFFGASASQSFFKVLHGGWGYEYVIGV